MDFGLCLPNFPDGASPEGIEAAASVAERLGWSTVWTTDHVLVPHADAAEYGRIYDAILTLAWVGARHPRIRLGTSVIVVPQRNAVILAKELATLDSLSGGRVIAGVGIGWNETEFANLGAADRFHVRGAYLDETIRLWRHLWSGATEPFHGRFHTIEDFVFGPLPGPVAVADRDRRSGRAGAAARRRPRRRLPLERDRAGRLRQAARGHRGRGRRRPDGRCRRSPRACASSSTAPPTRRTRCAARPRRWRPRSAPSPRSASSTSRSAFQATDPDEVVSARRTVRPRGRPARLAGDRLEDDLVDVAPHPVLAGLERADDRVSHVAGVLARVAVRG